jgi:hypothetical protein
MEDTDSGVEEAILQMDVLDLEDDDDNPPANIDTGLGPSQEVMYPFLILIYSTLLTIIIEKNFIDQNVDILPTDPSVPEWDRNGKSILLYYPKII